MEQRYIIAIEIGSSVIKGALGIVDRNGILSVAAIEEERLVDSVRYGIVQNGEEVGTRIQRIITRLERNAALAGRRIVGCYVALGGRGVLSANTEVAREFVADTELTEETVSRMREDAARTPMTDKEVIEVIPAGYIVDKLNVTTPVGTFGRSVRGRYTLLGARPMMRRNLRRVIEEKLGLRIAGAMARISAEGDLVLTTDERRLGCMLVDLGAETTTVAIYKGGAMTYAATLPLGSRNITRDLTALNCTEERAEELKKAVSNAFPGEGDRLGGATGVDGIDYSEINNYVRARAGEIVTNILEQPRFAGLKLADLPAGIIVVGRGSKLRGLIELIGNNSKLRVRVGSPAPTIRVTCASVQPNDAIDVIALLARAAVMPVRDIICVEEPEPEPEPEIRETDDTPYDSQPEYDDMPRRKKKPRGWLSRMFGGDDDDDEPTEDEDLLERERQRERQRELDRQRAEAREAQRAETRKARAAAARRDEDDEEADTENNALSSIKNRLADFLRDPESISRGNGDM